MTLPNTKALHSIHTAQATASVATGRHAASRAAPTRSITAPAQNATSHNSQTLACAWLARFPMSSTSSGKAPIAAKASPASSSICPATRSGREAVAGIRSTSPSAASAASSPGSTKPIALNIPAPGTPVAPNSETGWRIWS